MVNYPPSIYPSSHTEKKALDTAVFHNPDVVDAAKNLLGCSVFTKIDGHLTGGIDYAEECAQLAFRFIACLTT